jgi:dihydrofolate reductase
MTRAMNGATRKVILFIATSLDGFIARNDGSVDWLFRDGDYGMAEFFRSIDTVLIGRKTHDVMSVFGQTSYRGRKNYVFSRSPPALPSADVEYTTAGPRQLIETLRLTRGKDIWLVGGSELIDTFLVEQLVDRITVSIHPVILGEGIPLFRGGREVPLELRGSRSWPSGLAQLDYDVRGPATPSAIRKGESV